MRSYAVILGLGCVLLLTGAEQGSTQGKLPIASAGVIEDFKIPERDSSGSLLWLMQGERARIVEEGRILIFNVQVSTYRKGQVDQTLTSPQCTLIRNTENSGRIKTHAESTNSVRIAGRNIMITADGFQWFPDQTRLVMQRNVQVVLERKGSGSMFKPALRAP